VVVRMAVLYELLSGAREPIPGAEQATLAAAAAVGGDRQR
jgi:hypothetical protein